MPIKRHLGCAALALAMAACSDSPSGPSSPTVPDVAALLSEMSSPTVRTAEGFAGSPSVDFSLVGSTPDPGACTYTQSTGFFVCPTVTSGSLTITRMFRLIDGAGNSQSRPDLQTSAIETKTSVTGTLTSTTTDPRASTGTYTINSNSDQTLSGLRAENHTLNGLTTTTTQGTLQLGATTLTLDDRRTETTSNLVLPNVRKGQKWPLTGTIAVDETTNNFDTAPAETYHATITFDGTSIVTLTLTTPFGSSTCKVDLAARQGSGFVACVP